MAGEVCLGEVAEIIMGQSPPGETYNQNGQGLPFFQGVADFNYRHPTPRVYCTAPSRIAEQGDILLSVRAPIGRVNVADRQCAIGRGLSIIRPRNRGDGRYLEFALRAKQAEWGAIEGGGSVFGNATRKDLERLVVSWPFRAAERRAIAHILGTLDDKIELNRRMSETLEAMARALFKAWFVDFEPVRAKIEGRWKRGESLPGLPAHLYDLFPDRLIDSELGEIPEGWEVEELGDLVVTIKGRSYKSEELVESDTALVTLKSFARGGGYRPDGLKSFAGTYKEEQVVNPGEVVIACTDVTQAAEVIGRPVIVRETGRYRRLVASLDTLIIRPHDSRMTRAFLYFLAGTEAFFAHTYAHTTGTTVLHLAKQAVSSFLFARPSKQLVQLFDATATRALDRIQALDKDSETLAALRDTLLPKLISGELRVKDAETFLERVAV